MSKRKVFHITPDEKDGWNVKKEDSQRASKNFKNKKNAINYRRQKAKQSPPGQLKIHKKDGKIQTEYTYRKDPYPPKG